MNPVTRVGPYEIIAPIGAGSRAHVRVRLDLREPRRGLAEADAGIR